MKPEIHQGDTSPASASQRNSHHTRQPQASIPIFFISIYIYLFLYIFISCRYSYIYIYIHISCLYIHISFWHLLHPPQAFTNNRRRLGRRNPGRLEFHFAGLRVAKGCGAGTLELRDGDVPGTGPSRWKRGVKGGGRTPITTGGFIGFTKCLLRLCLILIFPEN